MVYKYLTMLPDGTKSRGVITCDTIEEAEILLKTRQETILNLIEISSSVSDSPYFNLKERTLNEKILAKSGISSVQIEMALEQLGAMLEGGVPILNAFQTVAAQSNYFLSRALFCVANKLKIGRPLAPTLQEELPFLGNVTLGLLAAGEANGDIDKMCMYSVELLERKRKLKGQLLQAMAYPALVIVATVGVVTFLMLKVIPKIMTFLSNRSAELPSITQALVDVTDFLKANGLYLLAAPVILTVIIILLRKNEEIAMYVDYVALRLPIVGKIFRSSSNMLWCRTLGILLGSGINIVSALEFTQGALNNYFYKNELKEMKAIVSQGHPLSTALRVSRIRSFIPLADSMLVVGENTGRMDSGLMKVADFSDVDLQRRIALMAKMIEPALFVIVGGIVGFVYIAFFMGLMAASTGK